MELDTEAQQAACAWLAQLKADTEKEPFAQLFSRLQKQTTVLIVNQANAFAKRVSAIWREELGCKQDESNSMDIPHCSSCSTCLYYWILHSIMHSADCRQPDLGDEQQNLDSIEAIASNEDLQTCLMHCASEIVNFAHCPEIRFPGLALKLHRGSQLMGLWHAIGMFWSHMSESDYLCLSPQSIIHFLAFMRMRITEQLAWKDGSDLYSLIEDHTEPGKAALLKDFLIATSRLAASRTVAVVSALAEKFEDVQNSAELERECLTILDELLVGHLDICFNQHLSNLVSCCVYGAARKLNIILSFKRINKLLLDKFPHQSPSIFSQAEISPAKGGTAAILGETRQLYNSVFLPSMQDILSPKLEELPKVKGFSRKSVLPLRSLSASDMNIRTGNNAGRMASMQKK